jgi:hypothetical protein
MGDGVGAMAKMPLSGHIGMVSIGFQYFGKRGNPAVQMSFIPRLLLLFGCKQLAHVSETREMIIRARHELERVGGQLMEVWKSVNLTPSLARVLRLGVSISLPKLPRSVQPMSSDITRRMFGLLGCRLLYASTIDSK